MAARYIIRRLMWTVVTLVGISLITFILIFAGPTDPARALTGDRAQGVSIDHVREQYGLDQPLYRQYLTYMGRLLRGDLGDSFYFRRPVSEALMQRLPATGLLAGSIIVVAMLIGIPLGALAALRQGTLFDRGLMVIQLLSISLPTFFLGLLLIYVFAFRLEWLPVGGYGSWRHLILPTLAVAVPWSAWYAIFLRSSMLDVISADYVRTARAKGLAEQKVILKHVLKNALIPVVTLLGPLLAALATGSFFVEQIFAIPGMGKFFVQSMQAKDQPMILGVVLIYGVFLSLMNLVVDVIYGVIDPRIRLTGGRGD